MIQLSTDLSTGLSKLGKFSLATLLFFLDDLDTHGKDARLEYDIDHRMLQQIFGRAEVKPVRFAEGLEKDNMVKLYNDTYVSLWSWVQLRKNHHNVYEVHVKMNSDLIPYVMELDHKGYSKVCPVVSLVILNSETQGRRSMALYWYLMRKKYRGDVYMPMPEIRRVLDCDKMATSNATRRIIEPCFENVAEWLGMTWRRKTYKNEIWGYDLHFDESKEIKYDWRGNAL